MLTRFLGSEQLAAVALRALGRLRKKEDLSKDEEYAVERLSSWLGRVGGADLLLEEVLDETQREFLLSYRLPLAEADRASGAGAAGPGCGSTRQYILPARTPRSGGTSTSTSSAAAPQEFTAGNGGGASARGSGGSNGAAAAAANGAVGYEQPPSRSASEEVEAVNDPDLQEQLRALEDWERFDVFRLSELTGGRPLQAVTLGLLRKRGLVSRLRLPEERLRSFLADVEEAYHPHNPYHNSTHAADVTQALGAMLAADEWSRQLSDLEQLAVILAACIHDVGHPGVSNDFLIRTQSEAAVAYNDQSINENMHAAAGFKLLCKKENNFLCGLSEEDFRCVRRLVIRIILSTDMARHHDSLEDFTASLRLWGPDLRAWTPDKRAVAMQLLVHAADISNPARPLRFSSEWGRKVHEEFFAQGDKEAALGLSVSAICDRRRASVPQSQLTFVEYVVRPCFSSLSEFAPNFVARVLPHIEAAQRYWREQLQLQEQERQQQGQQGDEQQQAQAQQPAQAQQQQQGQGQQPLAQQHQGEQQQQQPQAQQGRRQDGEGASPALPAAAAGAPSEPPSEPQPSQQPQPAAAPRVPPLRDVSL